MTDEPRDLSFTDFCPVCENALMVTDGIDEWCRLCGYERKLIEAPLDSEIDAWHVSGLA